MKLSWNPSTLAAAAYAGWLVGRREMAGIEPGVADAVSRLDRALRDVKVPTEVFWDRLLALTSLATPRRQAVEKALGEELAESDLAATCEARLEEIEDALLAGRPRLAEELVLRSRPMREAWETVGPGLMRELARATSPESIVSRATIAVVPPFRGGGGASHPSTAGVTWEGMLAHPHPELPETLRIAWLLARLGLKSSNTDPCVAALATLSATIEAGAAFDLCRDDEPTIRRAIEVWLGPEQVSEAGVEALLAWRRSREASRPPWETSLIDLEQSMRFP